MRVVADSNVYISVLNFGGAAEAVLALARAHVIDLSISPSMLTEIEGVLGRKFQWAAPRARQALALMQGFAAVVQPQESIHVITQDDPDNRILECAVAVQAHVLTTGDRHLRKLKAFRTIRILTPGEFLEGRGK